MNLKNTLTATLFASALLVGCDLSDNGGGANNGQQTPGNMDDGVALEEGEIAVSPKGTSFLARVGNDLIRGDVDGSWDALPNLDNPERLIFAPERSVVYIATDSPPQLHAHDLTRDERLWTTKLHDEISYLDFDFDSRPWLHVTSDDRFLVVVELRDVTVFDARSGAQLAQWSSQDEIVDVDLDPSGDAMYVAYAEKWEEQGPLTAFSTFSLPDLKSETIWLPNCSDEVVMDEVGRYAFMAPTTCQQDPVSVVDLQSGEFVRNLPGFGPIALASQGDVAVAFMDLDNLDSELFLPTDPMPKGEARYHLMLIDTRTLEFTTVELGESLPRYAPTPDGKLLLIDSNAFYDDERVRIFDLQTGKLEPVLGPDIRLENFVLTSDSKRAFLVDDGAFELSIDERVIRSLPLSIIPTNINMTRDDRWVLLQDALGPVHVYDVESERVTAVVGEE